MAGAFWSTDFEFRRDHLRVKKTGARVPYRLSVLKEVLDWLAFFFAVQAARAWNGLRGRRGPALYFAPDRPRPWYLVWAVCKFAGARIVNDPACADAAFFFEDATRSTPPLDALPAHLPRFNFDCADVSKSRVAAVFEAVFGYPLAVDPTAHHGPMVEKSEDNGAHDGRIVEGPCAPLAGRVYQRVIDNRRDDGLVEDLRCPTILGRIDAMFIKRRPVEARFANANAEVERARAEELFSADERAKLAAFVRAMGLDWGGLDVLRDRQDGRIYVVDVNKTDMGPPTALALADQVRAARALARTFAAAFEDAVSCRTRETA